MAVIDDYESNYKYSIAKFNTVSCWLNTANNNTLVALLLPQQEIRIHRKHA